MRYSIVTAYYKNEDMTIDFLNNLSDKIKDAEVIVVNAGSKPIEHKVITKRVDLIENKSFSNSMNAGINEAIGDFIIVIGNDGFPLTTTWLQDLEETYKETRPMLVAAQADKPNLNVMRHHILKEFPTYYEVKMYPAICWFIPRSTIDKIGLFDERFLIGCYEDDDYVKRVHLLGGKIVLTKNVIVRHLLSRTVGLFPSKMQENCRRYNEKWNKR